MKKLVIITSGTYPSQGVLNLIKYISYSLINNRNFKKKYDLKIFIFEENLSLKLKKIIYNFYLSIRNFFSYEKKDADGRKYVGIFCPSSTSPQITLSKVIASLFVNVKVFANSCLY